MLNRAKAGQATGQELFDYYLGWLTDSSITTHFQFIPDARGRPTRASWGMRVEIEDLRRVVKAARAGGAPRGAGRPLARRLDHHGVRHLGLRRQAGRRGPLGLVFIDGGSSPTPVTSRAGEQVAERCATGIALAHVRRDRRAVRRPLQLHRLARARSSTRTRPRSARRGRCCPANLKPPIPVTNLAQYGYALDTETSPPGLVAAQAHLGHLAASGDPRGWDQAGELTPIKRYARDVLGLGPAGPRRHRLVSPAAADDRLAAPWPPATRTRRRGCSTSARPTATTCRGSSGSTRSARRSAAQRVLDAASEPRQAVRHPEAQPHARGPPRDLLAQRPELGARRRNAFVKNLVPFLRQIARP